MKSIIIGTAGHIDHGKTALVKALTGIDADRLAEEKQRGITIDLGFAHMELRAPNGEVLRLGFIDVPGHERFVRNMLAGAGGIDLVLLVIAADEAIMPQTREHLDILRLLGVQHGITVLTKSDAVDGETLDIVRLEVEDFLRGTFLAEPAPIVAVSSLSGAGLDDLKRALLAATVKVQPRDPRAIARLPIDRVFTMKGFGTVVTGTLIAGTIRREQELEVLPQRLRVRVRGLQVHGKTADEAVAGQRTALNLSGASTDDLSRGMILAPPRVFKATRRVDVQLKLLSSAPHPLKNRSRVHFHAHSMETVAEIRLHGNPASRLTDNGSSAAEQVRLRPGEQGFARLKLAQPVLLLPGDRFIIRQFSPVITIGGGVVLDAAPIPRAKQVENLLQTLAARSAEDKSTEERSTEERSAEEILIARTARRRHKGITMAELVAETGWTVEAIEKHLTRPLKDRKLVRIGSILLDRRVFASLETQIASSLADFHQKNPLVGGMNKEELRDQTGMSPEPFEALSAMLVLGKKIEVAGEFVRLPGHGVVMKDDEAQSKKQIEDAFASAGLQVPALNEVLAGLKVDKARAQKIVTLLLRDRVLIKVSADLIFHHSALENLRRQVAAYKTKSARIDVPAFKDLIGVTRKYAIPLLEYLDRERVTRRVGDAREIL
jgi:selenocysteine-specific elongation factor